MRQIAAQRRFDKSPRLHCCCDKTLVLGTQANLEEGKCEPVSKFNIADHVKIIDAPSLVDFNFAAATCHAVTRQLAFTLSLRFVARIQPSLNFVRQIAATKFCRSDNDFHMSHEAICCSCRCDVSQRFVASCVSAMRH